MPNHCDNTLIVSGPKSEREAFQALEFDANTFIPYPEEFAALDRAAKEYIELNKGNPKAFLDAPKDGYNQGGYEWCIEHWGTKWGMYSVNQHHSKSTLRYTFDSAWSPPLPVIKAMGERFPSLTFDLKFYEGGACFQGHFICKKGEVVLSEYKDYHGNKGG